jgi:hypothetical protein
MNHDLNIAMRNDYIFIDLGHNFIRHPHKHFNMFTTQFCDYCGHLQTTSLVPSTLAAFSLAEPNIEVTLADMGQFELEFALCSPIGLDSAELAEAGPFSPMDWISHSPDLIDLGELRDFGQ